MDNKTELQIERFKKGFPWLDIVAAATPQKGIEIHTPEEIEEIEAYLDKAAVRGKCKFVPASGAASRMFKDIFASLEKPNDASRKLEDNIGKFAFYDPAVFDGKDVATQLLMPSGLGYGSKPKGVLKFHKYSTEVRTAMAEHLVEGQMYMRNADNSVNLTFTISPEHKDLFEQALADVKSEYEKRYGVEYNINFTYQDKETDTVAVTPSNELFLKEDGTVLRRPAGHGALIYNLNNVQEELVSIKNIDNVCLESMLDTTARYKKVLMGRALQLRDKIFSYLERMDKDCSEALLDEIQSFLSGVLCVELPAECDRAAAIKAKLNRPIRVCGMVRNEGEPGGGPYIVKAKDGATSLQILESAQINMQDAAAKQAMKGATHFNPVDIVCCLYDYKGEKFNLPDYVDEQTGFISSKTYQGRELKALELPGLWNGSMSDWNTLFVEVPAATFNPVKTVLDLLRSAHCNIL